MIYEYEIISGPLRGKVVEVEHSCKDPAKETLEVEGGIHQVRRLISTTTFHLKGDCWSRTNYERGIQSADYVKKYGDKETRGY